MRQDGRVSKKRIVAVLSLALLFFSVTAMDSGHADRFREIAKRTPSPIPSPIPKWPPAGFKAVDGVYAKIPTTKELVGLLSAKTTLQGVVKQCQQYACGAVVVAATTGCLWWEVNSSVFKIVDGASKIKIGSLSTFESGSGAKVQKTIFLISGATYEDSISVSEIKVLCHRNSVGQKSPGNTYRPLEGTGT